MALPPRAGPGVQQLPAVGWGKDLGVPVPLRLPSIKAGLELPLGDPVGPEGRHLCANEKKGSLIITRVQRQLGRKSKPSGN